MLYFRAMIGVCDVCEIIDRDRSMKEVVECKVCNALLCDPCSKSPKRRIKAASIRAYRNLNKKPKLF
jgi:hypothetical protein